MADGNGGPSVPWLLEHIRGDIGKVATTLEKLDDKIDSLSERVVAIEQRSSEHASLIASVDAKIKSVDDRHTRKTDELSKGQQDLRIMVVKWTSGLAVVIGLFGVLARSIDWSAFFK